MKRSLPAILAMLLILEPGAWADVVSVWNVSSGSWHTAGNWSPSGVPTSSTPVYIGYYNSGALVGTATISSADASSSLAYIGLGPGANGTVDVTSGRTWTMTNSLLVGVGGTGTLTIQNSSTVSSTSTRIGGTLVSDDYYYGAGVVSVNSGGKFTTGSITMTSSGDSLATLNINGSSGSRGVVETAYISEDSGSGGGHINFNGGILRATGNQANFLQGFETGDVQIQNGGAFIDSNSYDIGISTSLGGPGILSKQGSGTLTLSGSNTYSGGTTIHGGTLAVATGGVIANPGTNFVAGHNSGDNGSLLVSGGSVSNINAYVGYLGGSVGAATVSSGTWTSSGELNVGYSGTGSLLVSGGTVSNIIGYIGYGSSSTGTATVSGGTWANSSALRVGDFGTGTLNITGTGLVTVNSGSGTVTLAQNAGSTGTLNLGTGGTVGTLNAAIVTAGAGTATVSFNHTGSYSFASNLTGALVVNKLGSGMTTLTGTNTYTGGTALNAGTLSLGSANAIGTSGTVSFGGGTLQYTASNTTDYSSRFSNAASQAYKVDTNGQNITLASSLSSSGGSLTKNGTGTLTLTGTNTYTGGTTVNAGTLSVDNDGTTTHGTLGSGAVTTNGGTVSGIVQFVNSAAAGSGSFTNNGGSTFLAGGGSTRFYNGSSAGSATFVSNGGTVGNANGGYVLFDHASTAGSATLTTNGGTAIGAAPGQISFGGYATTAGTASITNNGSALNGVEGGFTTFSSGSTAGNATITSNGGTVSGARGGSTGFVNAGTAANATLIANGGTNGGLGGSIRLRGSSTGGTAQVKVYGNGNLDISDRFTPSVAIGSLEGTGKVFLGVNHLTFGSNDQDKTLSGAIQDTGGITAGTGGSLTKTGTGTQTLSGTSTYTGATMVLQGKVLVDGSIATSSSVEVSSGATLGGHGAVSTITGAGTVSAGNSPGILTATVVDPSGGLDFLFEMTQTGSPFYDQAAASGNDVLRLTGATPFTSALGAGNLITVDFRDYLGALSNGLTFRGGFYADNGGDFYPYLQNATFNYLGLGAGESVFVSTVFDSANFAGGISNGYVTQFTIVVPEPSRALLLAGGAAAMMLRRRRKSR